LTVTAKRSDSSEVELEIEIPSDEMEQARERAFKELVRGTRIPGFRPGKASRGVFERRYGTTTIEERALEEVVGAAYARALEEHSISPLEPPQFEFFPRGEGGSIRLKAILQVRPEIELADLSQIKIDAVLPKPSAEEVDRALDALRREGATLLPVERPARIGDSLVGDYRGTIDGEPFAGGTAERQSFDLYEDRFIPGFVTGVVGMVVNEEREVEATFPEDYAQESLAGKVAKFQVTVHEIKEPELPALDDEFASRYLPRTPTLEALRAEMERRLVLAMRTQFKNDHADEYVDRLLALHDFSPPDLIVERELEGALRQRHLDATRAGKSWEAYLMELGQDEAQMREVLRPEARKRAKILLLIEEVARRERIQATNAEIQVALYDLSRGFGLSPEKTREALGDQFHTLVDDAIRSKTLSLMLERAITE
jgi:trigger factor